MFTVDSTSFGSLTRDLAAGSMVSAVLSFGVYDHRVLKKLQVVIFFLVEQRFHLHPRWSAGGHGRKSSCATQQKKRLVATRRH